MHPSSTFAATVEHLDRTDTVALTTPSASGEDVRTLIWAVTVDGVPYVRSGYGQTGRWYARALRARRGAFHARGRRLEVGFEPVSDPDLDVAIDRAYFAKYGDQWPTRSMTTEPARSSTLRVVPLQDLEP